MTFICDEAAGIGAPKYVDERFSFFSFLFFSVFFLKKISFKLI